MTISVSVCVYMSDYCIILRYLGTVYVPSVLRYCWLRFLTCKNCRPYSLYCAGTDVKPSLTLSLSLCLFRRLKTVLLMYCFSQSLSDAVNSCINTINCTGKIMSTTVLGAIAEKESRTYICSEDIRPCET